MRRRLFGRDAPEQDPRAAITQAIRAIREQQQRLDRHAGGAYAGIARVDQELRRQRDALAGAAEQIRLAVAAAERAADSAQAAGGAAAAAPFLRTAEGLRAQLDVVAASGTQLDALEVGAQQNVERTRALLAENRRRLGAALLEQVALLARLEELERKRLVAEALRKRPPAR